MTDAALPLLAETRVLPFTRIRRERVLPTRGMVLSAPGARVSALDVVAKSSASGRLYPVPLARYLRTTEAALPKYLVKKPGEDVQARDIIAAKPEWFGTLQRVYRAPGDGRIVAQQGAWLAIELTGESFELKALYRGSVVNVMPRLGVVIEATGALVQGVWGVGGEANGVLHVIGEDPAGRLTEERIDISTRGCILVAGEADEMALRRAAQERVAGLILGGLEPRWGDLVKTLALPTLITEGWGVHALAAPIFQVLAAHNGEEASLNTTSPTARPEVFIPMPATSSSGETALPPPPLTLQVGARVRVVGKTHFGEIGTIAQVPTAPRVLSGITAWGADVELSGGERWFAPWENLELIG